jgi:hypothetical protein
VLSRWIAREYFAGSNGSSPDFAPLRIFKLMRARKTVDYVGSIAHQAVRFCPSYASVTPAGVQPPLAVQQIRERPLTHQPKGFDEAAPALRHACPLKGTGALPAARPSIAHQQWRPITRPAPKGSKSRTGCGVYDAAPLRQDDMAVRQSTRTAAQTRKTILRLLPLAPRYAMAGMGWGHHASGRSWPVTATDPRPPNCCSPSEAVSQSAPASDD